MKLRVGFFSILILSVIFDLWAADVNHDSFISAGITPIKDVVAAPDFALKDMDGNDVSLGDYKGHVVFLNFWASWCPPCRSEMPSIERLHQEVSEFNVDVVTVNLGESLKVAKDFIDSGKYTFDVLLDSNNAIGGLYAVRSIPTTYIINKSGELVGYRLGAYEWDKKSVVDLLKELQGNP